MVPWFSEMEELSLQMSLCIALGNFYVVCLQFLFWIEFFGMMHYKL